MNERTRERMNKVKKKKIKKLPDDQKKIETDY